MKGLTVGMRVVIVAALLMVALGVGVLLVTGKTGELGEIANDQNYQSQCQLFKTQYGQACNCQASGGSGVGGQTDEAKDIKDKATEADCEWAKSTGDDLACPDVC